jgi:Anti-sigma-K factor rskA
MLDDQLIGPGHEKFKKLSALACSGSLAPLEISELYAHLQECAACREVFAEYRTLTTQGIVELANASPSNQEELAWDADQARKELMARVGAEDLSARQPEAAALAAADMQLSSLVKSPGLRQIALAACLVVVVGFEAYHLGFRAAHGNIAAQKPPLSIDNPQQKRSGGSESVDQLLATQAKRLAQLEQDNAEKEHELKRLQSALHALDNRSSQLAETNARSEDQIRDLSQQRDVLNGQLQAAREAYENGKIESASLRAERDKAILRTSSLEARNNDLAAANRDQEHRLHDSEQYLSSDRDIRELMGARQLYIADVFDVDGTSRTQRPFGRVFYTQGKSLIFYAFDLDREPGVVNASTFQVWGQREAPQGEEAHPMNLGIFYMDNESNRRWVMRFDDPKQLAEIDAVFVTVEPRGGSHKPTGKPFLYALLRKEANHP